MSHLDPYRSIEPRNWDRPDDPSGDRPWPAPDPGTGQRARQAGVAPDVQAGEQTGLLGRYPASSPPDLRREDLPEPSEEAPSPAAPHWVPGSPGTAGPPGSASDWPPYRTPPPPPLAPAHPLAEPDPPTESIPVRPAGAPGWPADASSVVDEPYDMRSGKSHDDPRSAGPYGTRSDESSYDTRSDESYDGVRSDEPEAERPPGRRQPGRRRSSAARPPTFPARPSRAGRNLPAAIGVGLGLGAAILLPLFFFLEAFLVVVAVAVAIGIWEMARAVRRSGAHPPLVPLLAGGVLTIGLAWWSGPDALSLGLLVTVLACLVWRLGDGPAGYQRDLTAATLIAVYVPFLGGFAALLAAAPGDGRWRVLVTLVAVVLSDTGGYAAGVSFGRHPMAPTISPKKSWEGFAGSVTAAALGSALLLWLLLDVSPWWGALFGMAVSGAAVLGDLAESMIKRDLGVKDMSSLLPGHGGLMDRLDSILFAVPTAYLLLAIFVPVG